MGTLWQDVKYAVRTLLKQRGLSFVAILTLALGIGATTAIFSVVNGVLLQPLPFDHPAQLVVLREISKEGNQMSVPEQNFLDWQQSAHSYDRMGYYNIFEGNVAGGSEPVRTFVSQVSGEFFDVLRAQPLLGRVLSEEDQKPGAPPVVVVSHHYWQRYLGADTDLGNKQIRSGSYSFTVVGVMHPEFQFPARADVWVPKGALTPRNPSRSAHNWRVIARLKADASLERARSELSQIAKRIHDEFRDVTAVDATVLPLQDFFTARIRPALLLLSGAVGFLLLIACANVTNLLLARATSREREFAVRAALGASVKRLIRQCVTESLVLAVVAALLGVLMAGWGVDALLLLGQGQIPRAENVRVDSVALAFALALGVLTSVLLGLVPGWRVSRPELQAVMNEASRGSSSGSRQRRVRSVLVVTQMALTVMLLVGAGLLARSFARVMAVNLGFEKENRLEVDVRQPFPRTPQETQRLREFVQRFEERVQSLPGVVSLGGANSPPMSFASGNGRFLIQGRGHSKDYWPEYRLVSPGYFQTLGIPLLRGRLFDATDGPGTPQVALISRDVAEKVFPGEDPIGQRINTGNMDGDEAWMTIVGVVADSRDAGPEAVSNGAIYTHYLQRGGGAGVASFTWVLHTAGNVASLVAPVREIMRELNPEIAPKFQTLEENFAAATAPRRFNLTLLGVFAGLALALACLGIYGVLAYSVEQRTREIGIRIALGAQRREVFGLIVGQGLRLVAVGLALGIALALGLSRYLGALLFEVKPADPITYVAATGFLVAVGLAACWIPARRAAHVEPMEALRYE